ncbi:unnamed protein product [Tilletia controversa]|nr:unnamed protein product [Tilletia controversa]
MDDRQPLLDAQQAILLPLPATWSGLFEASQPASDIPSSSQLCLGLLDDSDREVYAQIYAYIKEQYESRAYTDWMQIWVDEVVCDCSEPVRLRIRRQFMAYFAAHGIHLNEDASAVALTMQAIWVGDVHF